MHTVIKIVSSLCLLASSSIYAESLTLDEAQKLATEAYIYAYPLVTMDKTRQVMTNVTTPNDMHAPMGQFFNATKYPDASFKDVTAPNADTLYSAAWLDLSKEPYILHVPNEDGRYYMMPMLSGWTDVFASPGTRTSGTQESNFAITGPGWTGTLPANVKQIKSPTNMVWILGRTYSTGTPRDYETVYKLQKQYTLAPLSSYGKSYTPPKSQEDSSIDMKTPVRDQVNAMEGKEYFKRFAELLKENPPSAEDKAMVQKLKKLGLEPGQNFDIDLLDENVANAIEQAPRKGLEIIVDHEKTAGKKINGWNYSLQTGRYGTDYLQRAFVAYFGLGANLPQDAIYPFAQQDLQGDILNGKNKYVIHFGKEDLPPVKGFWSITMYNDQLFFTANPLNRYAISPRDNLKFNEDGSLDIYIQNEKPSEEKVANWLPAPKDDFKLILRLYWPDESILDGSWTPPAIRKINQ